MHATPKNMVSIKTTDKATKEDTPEIRANKKVVTTSTNTKESERSCREETLRIH